ncbi:esterase-like activity of phytase family protein [Streptomyces sp. NPDC002851]
MRRIRIVTLSTGACAALVGSLTLALPGSAGTTTSVDRDTTPRVVSEASLPRIPLGEFSNQLLPGSVDDDRGVALGGVGSGLFREAGGRSGEFWMMTDRGPNGEVMVEGAKRRTFPVPGFTPALVKVRQEGGELRVLRAIPVTDSAGKGVTGLSNVPGYDEAPYDVSGKRQLPYNVNGVDAEGLVRTADGEFWAVDEYGPSLLHISAEGKVLARHVPKGWRGEGADYPVERTLPDILTARKQNRGFEAIALDPDQRTLYLAMQSPLSHPDKAAGDASRNLRLFAFDLVSGKVTAEYAHRLDDVCDLDPDSCGKPSEMKVSGMVALGGGRLLLEERTDAVARIYGVDLGDATNILGGRYDDRATSPSLEQLAAPAADGIRVPRKKLVVDLDTVPGIPDKIEGIALADPSTLVVANDNDFGVGSFDEGGRLVDSGVRSRLITIRLPRPVHAYLPR